MPAVTPRLVLLPPETVVPAVWSSPGRTAVFNPAILRDGDGWIAACRVVGPDAARRVALCRLDRSLEPIPGTAVPWSDHVDFGGSALSARARTWFADPRLYRWRGRVFLQWNTGWHEPLNHQFLQEIDPHRLDPIGKVRELALAAGSRRPLEKNWLFFGAGGDRLLYSPQPLCVHAADPAHPGRIGALLARREWSASQSDAGTELRGGCPPVQVDGQWFAIGHTVAGAEGSYRYQPWVIRFGDQPDFALTGYPARPLPLPNPFGSERSAPKLNPAVGEVIYPCGADFRDGTWTISYGLNDERAAICTLPHEAITACLAPAAAT
ncbi:MAG TPA: hypothetical protein VFE31_10980 [Opitutaceae bacterium]|jgi:predicted GH43/DUF377 family glycosyl hydrolase|nr:hypothetical protein [Opitutaceae bacterium]